MNNSLNHCSKDVYSTFSPMIMGILNITPDSFYASSRCFSDELIINRVRQILDEGGDIVDIGGCSTRPGASVPDEKEEMHRVVSALSIIRQKFPNIIISVDTFRAEIARVSVKEFGASMINDVYGGDADPDMFSVLSTLNVPYILTHARKYECGQSDYLNEIFTFFVNKIDQLRKLGVREIILDPGFGFEKDLFQNYELLSHLSDLKKFDLPILVGISRKRMIWQLLNITPDDALNGTTVLNVLALQQGATMLRVHDVKEAVQAVKIMQQYEKCK